MLNNNSWRFITALLGALCIEVVKRSVAIGIRLVELYSSIMHILMSTT